MDASPLLGLGKQRGEKQNEKPRQPQQLWKKATATGGKNTKLIFMEADELGI